MCETIRSTDKSLAWYPQWVRCAVDAQLHRLACAQVAAAEAGAVVVVVCGRQIMRKGLTLSSESRGLYADCLAAGSTS